MCQDLLSFGSDKTDKIKAGQQRCKTKKQAKTGYRKAVSAHSAKRVTQRNSAFAALGMEFGLQGAEITKFGLRGAGWMHAGY